MKLPCKIRFIDENIKGTFYELEKSDKQLYDLLSRAFKEIESNAFCGIQIPKRLIPKEYAKKKSIHNLWKYNLPKSWRLLYSIENQEIIVVSIVLEWMDHKSYERRFRY